MGQGSDCVTSAKVTPLQKLIVLLPSYLCVTCLRVESQSWVNLSCYHHIFSTLSPDKFQISGKLHCSLKDEEHKRFRGEERVKVVLCVAEDEISGENVNKSIPSI